MRESELEYDIEQDVIIEASRRGHRLFKNKVGKASRPKKGGGRAFFLLGIGGNGAPDLWGWTKDGYFVAIEMKKPGETPKKHQSDWRLAAIASCPTLRIGWADSVEGAMEILEGGEADTTR